MYIYKNIFFYFYNKLFIKVILLPSITLQEQRNHFPTILSFMPISPSPQIFSYSRLCKEFPMQPAEAHPSPHCSVSWLHIASIPSVSLIISQGFPISALVALFCWFCFCFWLSCLTFHTHVPLSTANWTNNYFCEISTWMISLFCQSHIITIVPVLPK